MTIDEKIEVYNRLLAALSKGVKLAALLEELGRSDESKRVQAKNASLANGASVLRKNIHAAWKGQAAVVVGSIREASERLQKQIKSLEDTINTAEKVVKALGYIDDLIEIAKKVAAGV